MILEKEIVLNFDKFKSDISSPCKRNYHLGKHESWFIYGKKGPKIALEEKTTGYESREVEEKIYNELCGRLVTKNNLPGRCAGNKSILLLA